MCLSGELILFLRSLLIILVLMTSLPLLAKEQNVIHFTGGILALPLKAVSRCVKDAVERKVSEDCSGGDEGATTIHTHVLDQHSSTEGKLRREIVIRYD